MSSEGSPPRNNGDGTIHLTLPSDIHPEIIDEVCNTIVEVDDVSNNLSRMVINTASRLIKSNSAAFETFRRLDGLQIHRKIGDDTLQNDR